MPYSYVLQYNSIQFLNHEEYTESRNSSCFVSHILLKIIDLLVVIFNALKIKIRDINKLLT